MSEIDELLSDIQNRLTLEGKKRIFEDRRELTTDNIKEPQDPEEFTRSFLIDRILFDAFKVELIGRNRKFHTPEGERKVDYAVKHGDLKILIEAKPINADLVMKSKDSAVNQIIGVFRLVEVVKKFDYGVATDGMLWIFINKERETIAKLDIRKNFNRIKKYILGEERLAKKKLEEISKKFYEEYNDLLHGVNRIPITDCLVNSIIHVDREDDREELAQIIVNRLMFIKFLQSMGIVKTDVLDFLHGLEEHDLNLKLNQLFFEVMNTRKDSRGSVDPHFANIPYLNGSLFEQLEVERQNPQYRIRVGILRRVIDFLNRFRFARIESPDDESEVIDPEILGYIFEKSMTATDRKGTGAYYTPREITRYIAENTIYPIVLAKVNFFLEREKGYKKTELLKNVDELLILPATSINAILNEIILKITVCDNACGSGAFLLAVANILFELSKNVNDKLGLQHTDVYLKKQILRSLYGVDINPRAIEIARLRLWLWLIESYTADYVEPLPNIEYNLEVGNSLIGYIDIEAFGRTKLTLDDFTGSEESVKALLKNFVDFKSSYESAVGDEARRLRDKIEEVRNKLRNQLDKESYNEIKSRVKELEIGKEEFLRLRPFHYGFEFYEIFDLEIPKKERGFDIVTGNPPYVDSEAMVKSQKKFRDILSKTYTSAEGNWDLYIPFFDRAMQITHDGGVVCFISPNKWLSIGYGKSLRQMLTRHLSQLCSCDEITVFRDAANSPVISFFTKHEVIEDVMIHYFSSTYNVLPRNPVPRKIIELDNWGMLSSKYLNTLLKISNQKYQLSEFCDVENPFTVSEAYELMKIVYDGKSAGRDFKMINTGTIDRFESLWGKKMTSYIKHKYLHPYVRKEELRKLMPKRFGQSSSPKLIISGIRYFESFLDETGSYLAGKSTIIIRNPKIDLNALNALLNSKLIGFYMREAFKATGIGGGCEFHVNDG